MEEVPLEADEDDGEAEEDAAFAEAARDAEEARKDEEEEDEEGAGGPAPTLKDPVEYGAQRAMGYLSALCDSLDLRWEGCTINPDDAIWSKLAGTYMRRTRPDFRLTFSSYDSFHCQLGRFLAAILYGKAGLEPRFTPGGAYVWRHGWPDSGAGGGMPKCLHGLPMVLKPRTVELNPSSEAGRRALAEQGGTIERNRFNRQVVVLRYPQHAVCPKDKDHNGFPYPHAAGSCAMVFTDAEKAVSAMAHDLAWTRALYPRANAARARDFVLISGQCNCNYATEQPVSGRQLPRMIAYRLSGVEDITAEMAAQRADMRAHREHPHTMVFSCCNPQSSGAAGAGGSGGRGLGKAAGGGKNEKSCAWRLSYMDLRLAYVFAGDFVNKVIGGGSAPTRIPEFRWNDGFAFKTEVITPITPLETDDPFA